MDPFCLSYGDWNRGRVTFTGGQCFLLTVILPMESVVK